LATGGVNNASYVIATDVETYQLANYMVSGTIDSTVFNSASSAKKYIDLIGPQSAEGGTSTTPETARSIYIVIP